MIPGELLVDEERGPIMANAGRAMARLVVANTGDRPIQVGSHYHFFETNGALQFDRAAAYGMRLNIAAGTAVRFEPGEDKEVHLVALAGSRMMFGHRAAVNGSLDDAAVAAVALANAARGAS